MNYTSMKLFRVKLEIIKFIQNQEESSESKIIQILLLLVT